MRIVFMGCVQFSQRLLESVARLPRDQAEIVGVVTRRSSGFNSDFRSLAPWARRHSVACFLADCSNDKALVRFVRALRADVIYCFGWSKLLKPEILRLPAVGVVGYHPTLLPRNRGRHPIIWALALGLRETGSTFFWMDRRADAGDILDQKKVPILGRDDARSLYEKLARVACTQVRTLTRRLAGGRLEATKQNERLANVWRKRDDGDGRIDWRMPAANIHDLVRALARPYPGAYFLYRGRRLTVRRSRVLAAAESNIEPGKVLRSGTSGVLVQCGQGRLLIRGRASTVNPEKGDYL